MLTKEQAKAAADALTQQRRRQRTAAPINPFVLPVVILLVVALSAGISYFTRSHLPIGGAALVAALLVLVARRRPRRE